MKPHPFLLPSLLFFLLGGSLWLNTAFYNQLRAYYVELNQTRLDPVGQTIYPVDLQQPKTAQRRVVFFGDSRAASWPAPTLPGYEFINRGISSQTTEQSLQRFTAHVRSLQPDIVVIQVGVNDLKTVALFPDRQASIIANTQANIRRMVQASRQLGATVIVTTVFPVGAVPLQRRPVWSDQIAPAVQQVNQEIRAMAAPQVIVMDSFARLSDGQGSLRPDYSTDELHLNAQGYAALNQELEQILATLQRPAAAEPLTVR
jgi:lysophospholipase L1-like esterase